MSLKMRIIVVMSLLALPLAVALAQDPPPDDTPAAPIQIVPESTPEPVDETVALLTDVRADLDLLAGERLGSQRPEGWSGISDVTNPQMALLTRLDLEIFTGAVLGANERPRGWFGAVASSPFAIVRDIRHDLELLADAVVGSSVARPAGWRGSDPIMRCERGVQTLVALLRAGGVFQLEADRTSPNFCALAELEASQFAEVNLLANPRTNGSLSGPNLPASGVIVNSNFAVAFLDRGAARRAGLIPAETPLNPVGRSYAQFSNMMLVNGDGFEVFLDYQFTTMTREQFQALPDVDTLTVTPACQAAWCSGG